MSDPEANFQALQQMTEAASARLIELAEVFLSCTWVEIDVARNGTRYDFL